MCECEISFMLIKRPNRGHRHTKLKGTVIQRVQIKFFLLLLLEQVVQQAEYFFFIILFFTCICPNTREHGRVHMNNEETLSTGVACDVREVAELEHVSFRMAQNLTQ